MTAIPDTARPARRISLRGVNFALVIFVVLYAAIAILQPNYLDAALFMNFLRRAAH